MVNVWILLNAYNNGLHAKGKGRVGMAYLE